MYVVYKKKVGVLFLAFLLFTIPLNFAAVYWGEASTMTHDWEIGSAKFVSANFDGVLLGDFKTTTIMNYYGNFSAIYDDYSLYGERPDIYNVTFIEENNVGLVYIDQLGLYKGAAYGMDVDMNSFTNSTDFSCVYSNGYSFVFSREEVAGSMLP